MTTPARGFSWPPFGPGNTVGLRHGANSTRMIAPIARALAEDLAAQAPWTASAGFVGVVASWAWAEAQAALLRGWIDEHGMLDDAGEDTGAVKALDRVERRLDKARDALGLSPQALGRLLQTAASVATATGDTESLASLREEGRRILAARNETPAGG
jgi:hypothetical protein